MDLVFFVDLALLMDLVLFVDLALLMDLVLFVDLALFMVLFKFDDVVDTHHEGSKEVRIHREISKRQ